MALRRGDRRNGASPPDLGILAVVSMSGRHRRPPSNLLGAAALVVGLAGVAAERSGSSEPRDRVSFPTEYRRWVHVKSVVIGNENPLFATEGGIHHIYANDKAMEGLRTGEFRDGSILVYDLLSTRENGGITTEGPRRRVDVMAKAGPLEREGGGWAFERFVGDDRAQGVLSPESKAACLACHAQRRDHDFVFSALRP